MTKVRKEILIHAPVEKVFTFLHNPGNLQEIWPSMVEVKNAALNSIGGYDFDWGVQDGRYAF